jgi:hypothetical protein
MTWIHLKMRLKFKSVMFLICVLRKKGCVVHETTENPDAKMCGLSTK